MKRKKLARIFDAALEITPAEVVSLKAHKGFDEGWLERQIKAILGLSHTKLEGTRFQLRLDKQRRLNLLLRPRMRIRTTALS